ncbi:polyphosphate:AMP phosphotransferase [Deferribacteres bacterium DY0037]
MFEGFLTDSKMPKEEYEAKLLELRTDLIRTQYKFKEYKRPMLLVLTGIDGAGKGDMVNALADVMDSRLMEVKTFWEESSEEAERPYYWRFWNAMPMGGKLGVFFNGWYERAIRMQIEGEEPEAAFVRKMEEAAKFERMLALDGAVIVKVWAHITKKEQKKRHEKFKNSKEVSERANWYYSKYDKITETAETAYRSTHTEFAPWEFIDCTDKRYREIRFLQVILDAMKKALDGLLPKSTTADTNGIAFPDRLAGVDLSKTQDNYKKELNSLIAEIKPLAWEAYDKGLSTMLVFEGWDAAGKGGCIRRLLRAVDLRLSKVISIAAPTEEELSRHYLWRFWRQVPRAGCISIFDRSWYGRVLVERIEGYTPAPVWFRAYDEINDFEAHLSDRGMMLLKFFLHISAEEQMNRFQQREDTPWKQHKITEDDYRNRDKTPAYYDAYNEMFFKTDTQNAPWFVIPANDKKYARVQVLKTVRDALIKKLKNNDK